jgi:hypothetical protein
MSYEFYLVLHLLAVFVVVGCLSAMSVHMMAGGTRDYGPRKLVSMVHGIGLLVALVAGFGLLGKGGHMANGFPGWAVGKLVIWLVLGGLPALIYRKQNLAKPLWLSIFVFAGLAAYLAAFKPF